MWRRDAAGLGARRRRGGVSVTRWDGDGAGAVLTTALVSRARPSAATPAKVLCSCTRSAAAAAAGRSTTASLLRSRRRAAVLLCASGRSRATVSTAWRGHAHAHVHVHAQHARAHAHRSLAVAVVVDITTFWRWGGRRVIAEGSGRWFVASAWGRQYPTCVSHSSCYKRGRYTHTYVCIYVCEYFEPFCQACRV